MLTYGHLIGEVIRRITGQGLGEFFAARIAGPLGADFHIGLPPSEFHRVANVVPPPAIPTMPVFDPTQLDPNSVAFRTWTNPTMRPLHECSCTERWRRADIGAAHGHGNARSVARLQSAVACGGEVDGVRGWRQIRFSVYGLGPSRGRGQSRFSVYATHASRGSDRNGEKNNDLHRDRCSAD
jgi:CubicO group peptidase (beta-lactamase class C family)